MFAIEYNVLQTLGKIRRAVIAKRSDTRLGFFKRFDEYRRARFILTL